MRPRCHWWGRGSNIQLFRHVVQDVLATCIGALLNLAQKDLNITDVEEVSLHCSLSSTCYTDQQNVLCINVFGGFPLGINSKQEMLTFMIIYEQIWSDYSWRGSYKNNIFDLLENSWIKRKNTNLSFNQPPIDEPFSVLRLSTVSIVSSNPFKPSACVYY